MKNSTEIKILDKETWKGIAVATLYNIQSILDGVRVLLETNIKENKDVLFERPYLAAGLYTFAIEEYGKYLMLESITENDGKCKVNYKNFLNHTKKFQKALEIIPEECKLIHKGSFSNSFSSSFDVDEIADFEARKSIFYSDLTDNNEVKSLPAVDAESLKISLEKFSEFTQDKLEDFLLKHYQRKKSH